jgi:hypothetical protein
MDEKIAGKYDYDEKSNNKRFVLCDESECYRSIGVYFFE